MIVIVEKMVRDLMEERRDEFEQSVDLDDGSGEVIRDERRVLISKFGPFNSRYKSDEPACFA